MATYSAKEAAERLGELLDKAAEGEEVVIARAEGGPVRLVPEKPKRIRKKPRSPHDIEWLEAHQVKLKEPVDLTALVRAMRDEGH
jgi:antitoxin (DNA-binding transcriptional repressor) of toxin-antitoxin stability system